MRKDQVTQDLSSSPVTFKIKFLDSIKFTLTSFHHFDSYVSGSVNKRIVKKKKDYKIIKSSIPVSCFKFFNLYYEKYP